MHRTVPVLVVISMESAPSSLEDLAVISIRGRVGIVETIAEEEGNQKLEVITETIQHLFQVLHLLLLASLSNRAKVLSTEEDKNDIRSIIEKVTLDGAHNKQGVLHPKKEDNRKEQEEEKLKHLQELKVIPSLI